LHELARDGMIRKIRKRVAKLDEQYKPFAEKIEMLAKQFQDKAILALLEQYMENEGVHCKE
jgi:hypothetical protein